MVLPRERLWIWFVKKRTLKNIDWVNTFSNSLKAEICKRVSSISCSQETVDILYYGTYFRFKRTNGLNNWNPQFTEIATINVAFGRALIDNRLRRERLWRSLWFCFCYCLQAFLCVPADPAQEPRAMMLATSGPIFIFSFYLMKCIFAPLID